MSPHARPRVCLCRAPTPLPRAQRPRGEPAAPSCLALQSQYNFCTAIQFLSLTQLPQSRYKNCIVTHCLPSLQYNTCTAIQNLLLQYSFSLQASSSAIQTSVLQYTSNPSNCVAIHLPSRPSTTHSCNTICCIAIQFSPYATIQSNTSCNTLSSQPATHPCNTICCIAIQFLLESATF